MMEARRPAPEWVVIGVGNPYRGDDGAGPEVIRRLRARMPGRARIVDHDGEPAGLIHAWEGASIAVVVDAVCTNGSRPGEVHRIEVTDTSDLEPARAMSSHGMGPGEALELGRALDRLPDRLVILGIEGKTFSPGVGLSAEVERSIDDVVERVLDEVGR